MGVDWSLREGYAWAEDKEHCEEYGRMLQADPNKVSARAKKRGLPQVTDFSRTTCYFSIFSFYWGKKSIYLFAKCNNHTLGTFHSISKRMQIYLCIRHK